MDNESRTKYASWHPDRLLTELRRLEEGLQDLEETHAFTFGKTSVHIGAEQSQSMQEEFEEECLRTREAMTAIEHILKAKGG